MKMNDRRNADYTLIPGYGQNGTSQQANEHYFIRL